MEQMGQQDDAVRSSMPSGLRLVSAREAAQDMRTRFGTPPRRLQRCEGCGRRARSSAAVYVCRPCRYEGW